MKGLTLACLGNGLAWTTRPVIVPEWAWGERPILVVVRHVWAF